MRIHTEVQFYTDGIPGGMSTVLSAAGCGPDVVETLEAFSGNRFLVIVRLHDDDPRLPMLMNALLQVGKEPDLLRTIEYTDDELASARLLILRANADCEIGGEVGWSTTFDLSHTCPGCYANARQTAPYLIDDEEDLPRLEGRRLVASYWGHFLVDDRLADELVHMGVTGLSFHNVYALVDKKRQVKLRWKQLVANHMLPPFAPQTTGLERERPCLLCNRSGFHTVAKDPLRIAYREADLAGALDFNDSWEGFGYATLDENKVPSQLSVPALLVTPKVMHAFRQAGVTDIAYLPIRLVGEG